MAEDVDKDLRLMCFNAFVMAAADVSEHGKINFFGREKERERAKDTLSNAHLLLISMGVMLNTFFKLEADAVLERLGKGFERVWRFEHAAGKKDLS